MECITWLVPILPGKLDEWKAMIEEIKGPRREELGRSMKGMGIVREVVSLMQTPQGDFVCLFDEAEDLAKAFRTLATSDDPFDVWFREQVVNIHGLTPEMLAGPPPSTLYIDYRAQSESAHVG